MLNKNNIRVLLSKMSEDMHYNVKKIKSAFGNLDYTDDDNQSILHILVDDKYDETKCFLAIKSLLKIGLSPNLEDDFEYNFIQTALYAGYSEEFILNIINESLKYNLNINHIDSDKDTIMHTAIYSDYYLGEVERIYDLLCSNGYDCTKVCSEGRNLLEAMIFQKQYSKEQIESFKKKFEERYPKIKQCNQHKEIKPVVVSNVPEKKEVPVATATPTLSDKDISELEKYGKVLTESDRIRLKEMEKDEELQEVVSYMLLHNVKLEQECIGI